MQHTVELAESPLLQPLFAVEWVSTKAVIKYAAFFESSSDTVVSDLDDRIERIRLADKLHQEFMERP